jgi:hypothetical protein
MRTLARGTSTAVLAALLIYAGAAIAQVQTRSVDGDLRVEGTDSEDRRGRPVMSGYVLGDVPPSNRSYFEIKAPAKAASYRVTIASFAWRSYGAGGG